MKRYNGVCSLLIVIILFFFSCYSIAQNDWKEEFKNNCRTVLIKSEPPGFWAGVVSSFSKSAKKQIESYNELLSTCRKVVIGSMRAEDGLIVFLEYDSKAKADLGSSLVDEVRSAIVGTIKFHLAILGVIATILGIVVSVVTLVSKNNS